MARPPGGEALARPGGEPEAAEIITALTTVLASSVFARAPRSRGFLAYVVTETLAGRGHRLSERTVGRHALRQSDTFDGSAASVVRVRATRVRSALAEYYADEGRDDAVRIVLSSGSYRPTFTRAPAVDVTPEDLAHGVAILRFEHSGGEPAPQIAHALSDALAARLEEFPDLAVVGPTTAAAVGEPAVDAVRLGLRFVLHGSVVVRDDQVRLTALLTDALSRRQVWRGASTRPVQEFAGFDVEDEWAVSVAGELGDWAGVINRVERETGGGSGSASYRGHLSFCAYQDNPVPEAIRAAARDLDAAIDAGDRSPLTLAMRGWIHSAAANLPTADERDADLRAAESLAREALGTDPRLAQAYVVLGNVALLREDWDLAARHARRAAELAPHHPTTLFAAATGLSLSGDWAGGQVLAREAFRLNPRLPGAYHVLPAIACLIEGDDAGALVEASVVHTPGQLWGSLYRAMALAGLGHLDQARTEMDAVLEVDPSFLDDPASYFTGGLRLTPTQQRVLLAHLDPFLPQDPGTA